MKILLADDHPMILQGTKGFLESLGYTISDLCSSGNIALSLIERHKPDVAILDINMPEMSGLEIAKQVQNRKLHCKVILLTMHNEKNIYKKVPTTNIKHRKNEKRKCVHKQHPIFS